MKLSNITINDFGLNNKVCISESIKLENKSSINITIKGNENKIFIGKECNIKDTSIQINGSKNTLSFDNYVTFHGNIVMRFDSNSISIGKFSSFGLVTIHCAESCRIVIGKNCMFSRNITLRTHDGCQIINNETKAKINQAQGIFIGDRVWCGMNTKILKGAYISSNTVIGAFSVVTKKFEKNNIIIAGKPANIVKENIVWIKQSIDKNTIISKEQLKKSTAIFSPNIIELKKFYELIKNIKLKFRCKG